MINLIFSFVFTTAETNLFYARLQKAAAINSENIRAVRHLEIFLGQTLRFRDKGPERRTGEGTPEVPVMCEGLVLPYLNPLVYLKGRSNLVLLSLSVFPPPPQRWGKLMLGGARPLGLLAPPPHLVPSYFSTQFLPSDPVWLPRLDPCSVWISLGEILHCIWFCIFLCLAARWKPGLCLSFPSYVCITEATEFTSYVAFAENTSVNVVKRFVI